LQQIRDTAEIGYNPENYTYGLKALQIEC